MKNSHKSICRLFEVMFIVGTMVTMFLSSHVWANNSVLYQISFLLVNQLEDTYEDDDTYLEANVITVNGEPQHHNFHDAGEQDWVTFYALSGNIYQIDVENPEASCDAVIDLLDAQRQLIDSADDFQEGEPETLSWPCQEDGIYYIRITNFDANVFGALTGYDLSIFYPVGGGIGTITGVVTDASSAQGLSRAAILSDLGGATLSGREGNYIMKVLEGPQTLTASANGYASETNTQVDVRAGESSTVDFSLTPVSIPFNVSSIVTDLVAPPAMGNTVQITFTVSAQFGVQYKWYARSGIGAATPGNWQVLANWLMNNNALAWSPDSDNRYLVLSWVAAAANSANFHQIGLIFETQGNSANPIQITGMTTNISYPQPSGVPITLNTTATGGSGQLYYKYFYRLGTTGTWNNLGAWSENGDATWTPQQPGDYTIVVHVSDDNTVPNNPLNQGGMTCTIGD